MLSFTRLDLLLCDLYCITLVSESWVYGVDLDRVERKEGTESDSGKKETLTLRTLRMDGTGAYQLVYLSPS
jgi:hypothetical protein